jgi:hypothetical protein
VVYRRVAADRRRACPDRSYFKVGMSLTVLYEEQKERNETLPFEVEP